MFVLDCMKFKISPGPERVEECPKTIRGKRKTFIKINIWPKSSNRKPQTKHPPWIRLFNETSTPHSDVDIPRHHNFKAMASATRVRSLVSNKCISRFCHLTDKCFLICVYLHASVYHTVARLYAMQLFWSLILIIMIAEDPQFLIPPTQQSTILNQNQTVNIPSK